MQSKEAEKHRSVERVSEQNTQSNHHEERSEEKNKQDQGTAGNVVQLEEEISKAVKEALAKKGKTKRNIKFSEIIIVKTELSPNAMAAVYNLSPYLMKMFLELFTCHPRSRKHDTHGQSLH